MLHSQKCCPPPQPQYPTCPPDLPSGPLAVDSYTWCPHTSVSLASNQKAQHGPEPAGPGSTSGQVTECGRKGALPIPSLSLRIQRCLKCKATAFPLPRAACPWTSRLPGRADRGLGMSERPAAFQCLFLTPLRTRYIRSLRDLTQIWQPEHQRGLAVLQVIMLLF